MEAETSQQEQSVLVDVALYGHIAKYGGGQHIYLKVIELNPGACLGDLVDKLGVPAEERGYLFINSVLCDAPGLDAAREELLHSGDHVGIFSIKHMWPYQYRDGIKMSESLQKAMKKHGAMHNIY